MILVRTNLLWRPLLQYLHVEMAPWGKSWLREDGIGDL